MSKHSRNEELLNQGRKNKIVSAEDAVGLIRDGDTLATGGFVGIGFAEGVAIALEKRFLESGGPKNLTLIYAAGQGDGKDKGLNHLGHEGLIKRVIGGHWGLVPKLQKLALANKIDAYNLPQGVISQMYRDIAAHKPRTITSVGLGTFVDPRLSGGKVNQCTEEEIVELVRFDHQEYLAYKTRPIQVAILRGTTADAEGNITMEKEALTLESLSIAMAAKNSGGLVIVQVERLAQRKSLHPRQVKIPGVLVDCVVVARPEDHWQTFATFYDPAFSSEITPPLQDMEPMEMSERKIIARRAAFELKPNMVINLGIGMPEGVASVALEEKILETLTLTAEPGLIGGFPATGLNFGAGTQADAVIDQPYQFDFYDGGGLDLAILGLAQADSRGNLNVSRFGPRLAGAGGFINISQNAAKIVFVGTFTAGDLEIMVADGQIKILKEGKSRKFIQTVEQITFNASLASNRGQEVLYVTERGVFRFDGSTLELIEIAPGIDLQTQILDLMDFTPKISSSLKLMDAAIFSTEPMNLRSVLLDLPLDKRLYYASDKETFFVNFENYAVRDLGQIEQIRQQVGACLKPLQKKINAVVNYDGFNILPDLINPYVAMVEEVSSLYYARTSRFTTSTFLRLKLGDEFLARRISGQWH